MSEQNTSDYFNHRDVPLLQDVMELFPGLSLVALVAKLARDRITYPISRHAELLPLFDDGNGIRYKEEVLTFSQVERFVPKEFFPIHSERDLLCKALIAYQRGAVAHMRRAEGQLVGRDFEKSVAITTLPSPLPATAR